MAFYVANALGESIDSPMPEQMGAFLDAIDVTDTEHGAAWLSLDTGPSLAWNGDGRLVLTGGSDPRHMLNVPRERALALWMALAGGHLDEVEQCEWKPGSGRRPHRIHVPSSVGRAALDELNRVPWKRLAHAYGTGRVGPQLYQDVEATLRQLGDADPHAFSDATYAFFSNLCHQGTIYEATAFAVPFLAALAAGPEASSDQSRALAVMLASIGVACSFDAPHGSHAGSYGDGVATMTREAFRVCGALLATAGQRSPDLRRVADALKALVGTDAPSPDDVDRLEAIVREIEGD